MKSPASVPVTLTRRAKERVTFPDVASTTTKYEPGVDPLAVTLALIVWYALSVTVLVVRERLSPVGKALTASFTVPVNAPRLDRLILDEFREPALKDRVVGEAWMLKSGRAFTVTTLNVDRTIVPLTAFAPQP